MTVSPPGGARAKISTCPLNFSEKSFSAVGNTVLEGGSRCLVKVVPNIIT